MKSSFKIFIIAVALLAGMLAPSSADACAVCMGASDSNIAPAANGAIFFMIGVVGVMLGSIGGFIFYLARRAKNLAQDPHEMAGALAIIAKGEQHA